MHGQRILKRVLDSFQLDDDPWEKGAGQKVQRDFSVFDSVPLRPMQTPPPTGVKGEIGFPVPARLLWPPSLLFLLLVAFYLSNFPFCNFSAFLRPIFLGQNPLSLRVSSNRHRNLALEEDPIIITDSWNKYEIGKGIQRLRVFFSFLNFSTKIEKSESI